MGVRKDAERIFDSKEFKNWKSNLLSKDPKKKLMAETDPKADYFDQIYFIFDRPGYMKDIRGYDMMSETEGSFKDGGIINLKGREMDLRGGGFVPIGKKERADDVPVDERDGDARRRRALRVRCARAWLASFSAWCTWSCWARLLRRPVLPPAARPR